MTPSAARLVLVLIAVAAAGCEDTAEAPTSPVAADAPTGAAPAGPATDAESTDTVLGVASTSADLSTFVDLARASGLDVVLRDTSRTLTVFAPSNAAFAALGADALAALRADPVALRARLAGHALPYRLFTGDVLDEQTVGTVGEGEITLVPGTPLGVQAGGVSARVATPDLDAGNGVVHVLDAVLGS